MLDYTSDTPIDQIADANPVIANAAARLSEPEVAATWHGCQVGEDGHVDFDPEAAAFFVVDTLRRVLQVAEAVVQAKREGGDLLGLVDLLGKELAALSTPHKEE